MFTQLEVSDPIKSTLVEETSDHLNQVVSLWEVRDYVWYNYGGILRINHTRWLIDFDNPRDATFFRIKHT